MNLRRFLSEQDKSGDLLFLYRGEEQRNIRRRLTNGGLGIENQEVFRRAFYFGDKARHFSVDVFDGNRNYLTGINDCSNETLSFIFDRIGNVLEERKNSKQVLMNTSIEFRDFFLSRSNCHKFVSRINESYTPETKLKARDYYLYFLHVAGAVGIRQETMFVSTSTNAWVARGFSSNGNKKRNTSRIIFHYFIPHPFHIHAIAPWVADHHQRIAYAIGLPTYKSTGLYPKQREVSVKGALFPHFILGIELVDERKFIINSHFNENANSEDFEMISKNGFKIDQTNFQRRIFDTGYIRWGQTDLAGNFESNDI